MKVCSLTSHSTFLKWEVRFDVLDSQVELVLVLRHRPTVFSTSAGWHPEEPHVMPHPDGASTPATGWRRPPPVLLPHQLGQSKVGTHPGAAIIVVPEAVIRPQHPEAT